MANPVVLIHGYSSNAAAFKLWQSKLQVTNPDLRICNYASLVDNVSIKDVARAFDRALAQQAGLGKREQFDAIVHSTGMLVIRAWLTVYPDARGRLKRLIGLAPATFGSPLAHLGRSWIGSLIQTANTAGTPNFLQVGDQILDALELGSRFTWDLAHVDLLAPSKLDGRPFYGTDDQTPYVFIFCGNRGYDGARGVVNKPGSDGTVRWAGVALDTRKITVDLTEPFGLDAGMPPRPLHERITVSPWLNGQSLPVPLRKVYGVNHHTIMAEPPDYLVTLVKHALSVDSAVTFAAWERAYQDADLAQRQELNGRAQNPLVEKFQQAVATVSGTLTELQDHRQVGQAIEHVRGPLGWFKDAAAAFHEARQAAAADGPAEMPAYQQFIVHAVDQYGDAVPDFNVQLFGGEDEQHIAEFETDVHPYSTDSSYRCFHVNLDEIPPALRQSLTLRLTVAAGSALPPRSPLAGVPAELGAPVSTLVAYHGFDDADAIDEHGVWHQELEFSKLLAAVEPDFDFFYPFTTTLVELRLNREPVPFGKLSSIMTFVP